ncbi:TPA: lysozyme family protein [Escherichia coli]|nr:lysozyme family protein [Escherichia coli]HBA9842353.1 lysozyme family protein [Escherichia coli]
MLSFLQRLRDDFPDSDVDSFYISPYDVLKTELGMLLSSRPLYMELEDIPFVCESVLNYGISSSIYIDSTEGHSESANNEISARILLALQRHEKRLCNPVVKLNFSDETCSVYSVTGLFFKEKIEFSIKWDKYSGEFSLYE